LNPPTDDGRKTQPRPQVAGLSGKDLPVKCINLIISRMSKITGYMLTWTTYGSWIPGDKRGYVKNGKILPGDLETLKNNKKRQKSSTVKLGTKEKEIIRREILSEAKRIGQKVEALSVYSNHIHLVVRPHTESIEKIAGRYKSLTTRALWKHGHIGRIWTRGFDKRFCFTEEEIARKIQYVNNHKDD